MDPKRFKELLEEAGYTVRSYSGRGMFGEECIAVSRADPMEIGMELVALADSDEEIGELKEILLRYSEDSLGLGNIVYWKQMGYPDE